MEKTRVPKGEKYWYIWLDEKYKLSILPMIDTYSKSDDAHFEDGNYFSTKEKAEDMLDFFHQVLSKAYDNEMLNKLNAVLNGADVIEMPSEEEVCDEAAIRYPSTWNGKTNSEGGYEIPQGFSAFIKANEWLKSKIVK